MPDGSQPNVKPRATTPEGIRLEDFARNLLAGIIDPSVKEAREYGGVIYRLKSTGALGNTGPFKGYSGANVDVGARNPNCGCPEGTTPVAWFHTHPTREVVTLDGRMPTLWLQFIEGDKLTSDGYNLIGYVATMDHRFWRYDPPPAVMVDGKPVVTEGPGTYGVLNGLLVPPRGR